MSDHKQPPKKVFDIMRPGKALAEPTSRPVIVGHKPEVKDEMVGGTANKMDHHEKRPLLSALAKVTIQPPKLADDPTPAAQLTATAPESAPAPMPAPVADEIPAPMPHSVPAPEASQLTPAIPAEEVAVSPSVNLPNESDTPNPKPLSDKLLEDAAKEPENPNPMTQHGDQVYVSHHKSRLTLGNALLTILLILVLTAVAVNFLLDADVLKTELGVPHTNWL